MNLKIVLNLYQLPENKLVARQNVTGWGLEKILAFARDQLISYNRLCCLADDAGGDNISGHMKAIYEAVPVEKNAPELLEALKELQKQIHAHMKMNVKKHFSLLVADAAASKAIHNFERA